MTNQAYKDYTIKHPTIAAARPTPNTMLIANGHGLEFCVRMVFQGDSWGLNNCLTNEKEEPLVEFYDPRYPHTEFGQFMGNYSASQMLVHDERFGLNIHGGVPEWGIDDKAMLKVNAWIKQKCDEVPGCLANAKPIIFPRHP